MDCQVRRGGTAMVEAQLDQPFPEDRPGVFETRNEVILVGRVSGEPMQRELPSGAEISSFRVVVDRPRSRRTAGPSGRVITVDTLDCVAWTKAQRRKVVVLRAGDQVSVTGALRRRFWRSGGAVASRYEVEVTAVRRLKRAEG
jgi:single-strand DNA-binding protein